MPVFAGSQEIGVGACLLTARRWRQNTVITVGVLGAYWSLGFRGLGFGCFLLVAFASMYPTRYSSLCSMELACEVHA